MNTNLTTTIATERNHRLVDQATEYRRDNTSRSKGTHRRNRVAAFLKDLAAASL